MNNYIELPIIIYVRFNSENCMQSCSFYSPISKNTDYCMKYNRTIINIKRCDECIEEYKEKKKMMDEYDCIEEKEIFKNFHIGYVEIDKVMK